MPGISKGCIYDSKSIPGKGSLVSQLAVNKYTKWDNWMEVRRKKGVYTVLAFFGVFGELVVQGEDSYFIS